MTNPELYEHVADDLAKFWHRDEALLDRNPAAWAHARVIDDWLVDHRDDFAIGEIVYQRGCNALLAIYHVGPRIKKPITKQEPTP